jgi:hypothetical protein
MRAAGFLLPCLALAWISGCSPPREMQESDPAERIPRMKKVAREDKPDINVLRMLVANLDDPDPAVRLYAFKALQSISRCTFDYEYYREREQRKPALQRWKQWLAEQEAGQPAGTTRPNIADSKMGG